MSIQIIWYYVVGSRNLVQSLRTTSLPRMVQLSYALIVRSPHLSEYSTQRQGVCKGVSTEIASQTSAWLLTWYKCNPLHHIWWEFRCIFSSTSTFSVMDFRDVKCLKNAQTGNVLKYLSLPNLQDIIYVQPRWIIWVRIHSVIFNKPKRWGAKDFQNHYTLPSMDHIGSHWITSSSSMLGTWGLALLRRLLCQGWWFEIPNPLKWHDISGWWMIFSLPKFDSWQLRELCLYLIFLMYFTFMF